MEGPAEPVVHAPSWGKKFLTVQEQAVDEVVQKIMQAEPATQIQFYLIKTR
jgi:hypothetical protein